MRLAWVIVAVGCLSAPAAHAYELDGARWPGRTITYYDGGPNQAAVKRAARIWNTSGTRLRLRPASRRRADVLIGGFGPARCIGVLGQAQLGYAPGRRASMRLARCRDLETAVLTAVHEFGHILGLNHEQGRCTVMSATPYTGCKNPPPYTARCRVLELDEVRAVVRRYGGRVKKPGPRFCHLFGPPGTPLDLRITEDAFSGLTAHFRLARPEQLRRGTYEPPLAEVAVHRYAGACPAGGPTGPPLVRQTLAPGDAAVPLGSRFELPPGHYCLMLSVVDLAGRRAPGPATVMFDITRNPPVAAITGPESGFAGDVQYFDDASRPGDAGIAEWHWDLGDPGRADDVQTGPYASWSYEQPGTYTVTLRVVDDHGQESTATHTVRIDPPAG